jgi:hypothetical protein
MTVVEPPVKLTKEIMADPARASRELQKVIDHLSTYVHSTGADITSVSETLSELQSSTATVNPSQVDVDELSQITPDLGHILAGLIQGTTFETWNPNLDIPTNGYFIRIDDQDRQTISWLSKDLSEVETVASEIKFDADLDWFSIDSKDFPLQLNASSSSIILNAQDYIYVAPTQVVLVGAHTQISEKLTLGGYDPEFGGGGGSVDSTTGKLYLHDGSMDQEPLAPPENEAVIYYHRRSGSPDQIKVKFPDNTTDVIGVHP